MLWPEWLVLSQLVLCWAPCLESIQCTEEQGRTEWGRCLCPLHRDVGAILLKPSSKHPPELQENLGAWCVRSHVAGKILICGEGNKMVWAEIGQSSQAHCPSVGSSHLPAQPPAPCSPSFSSVPLPRASQLWFILVPSHGEFTCVLLTLPALSHPFADKALLPLPLTHGFLFQSSLSGHPSLSTTLGSRSLPGLSCCGFTDFGEHLHALGSMGTTHWKALTVHSNNKDSTPWFAGDKTFSTQIHAGFRRWAISHQQFVVMFDQCYCSKKLYPFNFENHLHSIYTDSLSFSRRIKSTLTVIFTGRDVRYTLLSLNNLCKYIFDLYVFKKY